jgi:hypothetical protein
VRASRLVALFLLFAAAAASAQLPDTRAVGQWSDVRKWPFVAIHAALFPDGRIIGWARKDGVTTLDTFVGDPHGTTFTNIPNTFVQPFCAGQTFLPDGRLLVAGGHDKFDGWGAIQTTIFDSRTNRWTKSANMNGGRWYPTTSPLANGDVVVVSGEMPPGTVPEGASRRNGLPQVWSPATGTWRDLTTAIDKGIELYPWMLLAPNGRVFMAGPRAGTAWLDTAGTGQWIPGPPSSVIFRDYGSAVMYEPGKVLIVGGGSPPTASSETIDLNAASPAWRATATPMRFARRQMNATILADGTVLATGGTNGPGFNDWRSPVLTAELWDPNTRRWTSMAPAAVTRVYHSIALLLPDGTVLNAGGGLPPWGTPPPTPPPGVPPYEAGPFHSTAQIYSPPYLFRGARPVIAAAPAAIGYGTRVNVTTPNAAQIGAVNLIHPGAVTHAFDESQRFVPLPFDVEGNILHVTTPAKGAIAPPGPYMLFILNKEGVPSLAKWVTLQ